MMVATGARSECSLTEHPSDAIILIASARRVTVAQLLVRNIDADVVRRLKERARRHGRSLQGEAKRILTQAAGVAPDQARRAARAWQKRLAGRRFADSADLVREDRER